MKFLNKINIFADNLLKIGEPKVFSIDELDDLLVDGAIKNNFTKKCIINDYNRSVLSYFEKKVDYFIDVDM